MPLTNKKASNFSEWYLEVVQNAQLMDYSAVQGCMIIREDAYYVWERIQNYLNQLFAADGVRNAYFPLFIAESALKKEAEHFSGFVPEVAWVTQGGNETLGERLALRPTSETVMYPVFAKWISSHRDLPLKVNQWCNVIRWDTKTLKPFLRTREFLWQEGHTAHSSKADADAQVKRALDWYKQLSEELLAVPALQGVKTEAEKFPGALYTTTLEAMMPDGKALQMGTSHNLGQNFAKMFNVKFKTENETEDFAWQTSWGVSTRLIGAVVMTHGDDKGIVWPPKIAPVQVVAVPIYSSVDEKKTALLALKRVVEPLLHKGVRVFVDAREGKTPGFKFNEWELKGVPVRIEVGLKDLAKQGFTLARRDTGEKEFYAEEKTVETVLKLLDEIQANLLAKAKVELEKNTLHVETIEQLKQAVEQGGFAVAGWCADGRCEEAIKEETGADIRLIPFNAQAKGKCVYCGSTAKTTAYFARAY